MSESNYNDGRNYEQRIIPGVDTNITVNRDGDVQVDGKDANGLGGMITKLDGEKISIQMAVYLAFPDIPMRVTPAH